MAWLSANLALLSGVVVPLLLGLVKPLIERQSGGRALRQLRRHAELRALLPKGSEAQSQLDSLLDAESEKLASAAKQKIGRKVDSANLGAIFVVSAGGGAISYGLVRWAQATSGLGAGVLWVVFAAWTMFILLLVFVGGLPAFYKSPDKDI